jgi:hypothetical protein
MGSATIQLFITFSRGTIARNKLIVFVAMLKDIAETE